MSERDAIDADYDRASRHKVEYWIAFYGAAAMLVANLIGRDEPTSNKLSALCLIIMVYAGIHLWEIRKEWQRWQRRMLDLDRQQ